MTGFAPPGPAGEAPGASSSTTFDRTGELSVSVAGALDWARQRASCSPSWWAYRLAAVRGFAVYLHAIDSVHEVPAADLLPHRPHRASPYLYSNADIAALIAATSTLRNELRQATFATLIGLLAVTGMFSGGPTAGGALVRVFAQVRS